MFHGRTEKTIRQTHLVLESSSDSIVPRLLSSSASVTVTSFSRSFDSSVEMGRVTPRYLHNKSQHIQKSGEKANHIDHQYTIQHPSPTAKRTYSGFAGGGGTSADIGGGTVKESGETLIWSCLVNNGTLNR
jgi:hypothetical protein